jgi:hypothetical protein
MGRYRKRAACEGCPSIDVRLWHQEGRLRPNNRFTWSFWIDRRPSGGISVQVQADSVILKFGLRELGSDGIRPIDQQVPIVWTNCTLGGKRPWFLCTVGSLRCGRRVAKLYFGSYGRFECRQCCGLVYASQQQTPRFRAISLARKIRMKLGAQQHCNRPFLRLDIKAWCMAAAASCPSPQEIDVVSWC